MVKVGVHVSIAGSIDRAVGRAVERGCDTFQIFSRNPRGWRFRPILEDEACAFSERLKRSGISPVVDHMPYLPNLASPKDDVYVKSVEALEAELKRCGQLGIPYLVTHLGSHLNSGKDYGIRRIVDAVDTSLSRVDGRVMLLLENTAGTRNSMGGTFEDIGRILDILGSKRVGVCFDTCHAFAAGYELRTAQGLTDTLDALEGAVGLGRLKVVHLNDCKGGLGSRLDRHEHIGLGGIGREGFENLLSLKAIRSIPMILETPVDDRRDDVGNLEVVRTLAGSPLKR